MKKNRKKDRRKERKKYEVNEERLERRRIIKAIKKKMDTSPVATSSMLR